jgi:hypothetical protein
VAPVYIGSPVSCPEALFSSKPPAKIFRLLQSYIIAQRIPLNTSASERHYAQCSRAEQGAAKMPTCLHAPRQPDRDRSSVACTHLLSS